MFIQMSNEQFLKEYNNTKIHVIPTEKPLTPILATSPMSKLVSPIKSPDKVVAPNGK